MKKNSRYSGGFTLIELLVVIAIIGILSSVVLVSLNSARNKAKDARVEADVSQTRTALESGFNGTAYPDISTGSSASGAYGLTNCTTQGWLNTGPQNAALTQQLTDACNQGGAISIQVGTGNTSYAIFGRLVSNPSAFFCIDSTGKTNAATTSSSTNFAAGPTC